MDLRPPMTDTFAGPTRTPPASGCVPPVDVGVRLTPTLVVEVVGLELLMAVALTAFGVFIASRISKMESFQVVMQLLLLPMLFLSGAMFPLSGLPSWLAAITRVNPLTYAVDPLRHVVFAAQRMAPAARARLPTGIELFGRILPLGAEIGIVVAFAVLFLGLAVRAFGRPE
jgi:ABC-2 type transport system permease protein